MTPPSPRRRTAPPLACPPLAPPSLASPSPCIPTPESAPIGSDSGGPAAGAAPATSGSPASPAAEPEAFSSRVRQGFGRGAASYERAARLQQGVAWRLARLCRNLPLPAGPRADLGAGSGLLSRALLAQEGAAGLPPPEQIDLCPELLSRNPLSAAAGPWDLNRGLPPRLQGAALLLSSFALQWLDDPPGQLAGWCRQLAPGGWLALAVPVAGSFPAWRAAARAAAVPCSALPLPAAGGLVRAAASAGLELHHCRRLRFSRPAADGLTSLRLLRALGASASRQAPLSAGQLRRLLAHWPPTPQRWEVLLLVGRRACGERPAAARAAAAHEPC